MFSSPVTISNRIPPTSSSSDARSSACAGERTGGHANSFGTTDHSLASTTGTSTSPSPTCTPCVSRYSHDGEVGQSNHGRCRITTSKTDVSQGPRSGLVNRGSGGRFRSSARTSGAHGGGASGDGGVDGDGGV